MMRTWRHISWKPLKTYSLIHNVLIGKASVTDVNSFSMYKRLSTIRRVDLIGKRDISLNQLPISSLGTKVQRQPIQRNLNPIKIQSCQYHVLSTNRYKHESCHSLLGASNAIYVNNVDRRHFSMSWLDSLAITQAGWFRSLAESKLVESLMGGLQGIHDSFHLPWWGTIIVSTILMRGILTFPLAVYQNYIFAKVENLKPEMDELIKELKMETAIAIKKFGWSEREARITFNRSAKKIWKELIIRDNCHPFKASLLLWVQIPLWISMSMSFRNMASMMPHQDAAAQVLFLEMSTGGFGWIPNLTEVDHSLILPVAMGILNLAITEVSVLSRLQEGSKLQKISTNLFRAISIIIIPIASTVPSCVALYWVTSSACGLVQNLALMHPGVRRMCGIPYTALQQENPYQHLWMQLQKRFQKDKKLKG